MKKNLQESLSGHSNSLGLLRLLLALMVIFDHAMPVGGFGEHPLSQFSKGQTTLGEVAVIGFFGISGYLITKSGMASDVLQFFWRRALRIFPAYWTVLVVSAALVGPVFWFLSGNALSDYLATRTSGPSPVGYVSSNFFLQTNQWGIRDIFIDTPWGHIAGESVFNGSLWTLEIEWLYYALIGVLVLFGVFRNFKFATVLLASFFAVLGIVSFANPATPSAVLPIFGVDGVFLLGMAYSAGSVLAAYSGRVPVTKGLALVSVFIVVASMKYGGFEVIGVYAFVYLLLALGGILPKQLQWVGAKNDYSYGIYIYGFLVQQMLAQLGVNDWGYAPYVAITIVITWGFAWLSWHGVEKWAMRLKDIGPGRGARHWWTKVTARIGRAKARA